MARNKLTPLKDEPENNIDGLYQKVQEVLDAVNNRNLTEAKKLWNLGDKELTLYALNLVNFNKAVNDAMDDYLKTHQDKIVVECKNTDTDTGAIKTLLEQYQKRLDDVKEVKSTPPVTIIDKNVVEAAVNTVVSRVPIATTFINKPEPSTTIKGMFAYQFYRLPLFYVHSFFASCYVRWWFKTVMLCVWLTSVCLTIIVTYDNARLEETKQKYILLREFCRTDKDMRDKADLIEYLYTDKEEHKETIDNLWELRRKRLSSR